MSVIKCPECGGKVSTTTEICIHCGYKFGDNIDEPKPSISSQSSGKHPNKLLIAIAIAFGLIIVTGISLYFALNIKDYLLGEQALSNNDTKLAIQYIVNSKVPWKEAKITELIRQHQRIGTKQLIYLQNSITLIAKLYWKLILETREWRRILIFNF